MRWPSIPVPHRDRQGLRWTTSASERHECIRREYSDAVQQPFTVEQAQGDHHRHACGKQAADNAEQNGIVRKGCTDRQLGDDSGWAIDRYCSNTWIGRISTEPPMGRLGTLPAHSMAMSRLSTSIM